MQNMLLSILYVTVVYASESAAQEIPLLVHERAMFYREIDSKFYSVIPYYISRVMAQFPLILTQTAFFCGFIYPMAYMNGPDTEASDKLIGFCEYFVGVLAMLMTATTFSQMLAICTPNEGVGNVLYTTICTLCRMFGGFLIKLKAMWIGCRVVNTFNFFKYALFYFAGTQLTRWKPNDFVNNDDKNVNGESIFDQFREKQWFPKENETNPWMYFVGLMTFLMTFHLIAVLTLKFKRWDKR